MTQVDINFDPEMAVCNPKGFWYAKIKSVIKIAPSRQISDIF